ncbi:hypothetical protein QWY86_03300 [Pedobacter aquatilis]|uniref:hypothetical protein n=1 Tax=Pedobacter aquatilis TaxID=351343 RepID=UPI0025B4CCCB|nr:hypothetical protein [Pedobacter aquatilis]MDN3585678.1 hypothetical protein [Pedobacter aquatilis]
MDIKKIDDLLKYLSAYTQIIIGEYTNEKEKSIVLEAEQLKLIYKSKENTYHLDRLGKEVVDTRLSWATYQAEKESEKYSFSEAIRFGVQAEINKQTIKKTGRRSGFQSFDQSHKHKRFPEESKVLPHAPDLSTWQKIANFQDSPQLNQRIAFWAGILTIISAIIAIVVLFTS